MSKQAADAGGSAAAVPSEGNDGNDCFLRWLDLIKLI